MCDGAKTTDKIEHQDTTEELKDYSCINNNVIRTQFIGTRRW